jgi:2-keto-4-pentenoate hydratase/2-oxohepta-3-ene-1,7-dioic acid hydratase in catechol pathway
MHVAQFEDMSGPITHGDVMVCRIKGIGELRNPVRWR